MTDHDSFASIPLEERSLIERMARHLATKAFDTAQPSAGDWPSQIEAAAALLAIIKDPDVAMSEAGDAAIWRKMIDAALVNRWTLESALGGDRGDPPGGSDEEGDVLLEQGSTGIENTPSWIQLNDPPKP